MWPSVRLLPNGPIVAEPGSNASCTASGTGLDWVLSMVSSRTLAGLQSRRLGHATRRNWVSYVGESGGHTAGYARYE
jgi:hypothetical protein